MYRPPVPAVPPPGMAGPSPLGMGGAPQYGAFFNYMGMGQLPKGAQLGALSQLQNSNTANWMASLSSPAGSAPQRWRSRQSFAGKGGGVVSEERASLLR